MTIDEHIHKAEEDAKMAEFDTVWGIGNYFIDRTEALEYAKECRQLAEWLKELKKYREILTELDAAIECYENCESYQGFREYSTSQFIKDIIRINKEVIK